VKSPATSVPAYLKSLPAARRAEIEKVRAVVNKHLDRGGYQEGMGYGMICWSVPHRVFPAGYHCDPKQPLPFGGLASQKNYCAVYVPLMVPGRTPEDWNEGLVRWFVDAWKKAGKKLDMGKCCIRFQRADDLALDVLAELIRRIPAKDFVASYLAAREELAAKGPKPRAAIRAETARKAARRAKRSTAARKATGKPAKRALAGRSRQRAK
jgi:hypothetical protein